MYPFVITFAYLFYSAVDVIIIFQFFGREFLQNIAEVNRPRDRILPTRGKGSGGLHRRTESEK